MNRDGHCCIVSLRSYLPRRLQRLSATIASLYYLRRTQFGAAALHCSSGTGKKKRETREKESKASNAIFPLSDWHCTKNIVDGTLDLQDEDDGEKKTLGGFTRRNKKKRSASEISNRSSTDRHSVVVASDWARV